MDNMAFTLTGFPALLLIVILLYILVYLPLKLVTKVVAHAKAKAARVQLLKQGTIIAEYDPPSNLTPAEMGYLFDGKLTEADIFGTIVDLQQRSLVQFADDAKSFTIAGTSSIVQTLRAHEQNVIAYLAQYNGQTVSRTMLRKLATQETPRVKQALQEQGFIVPFMQQMKRSFSRIGLTMLVLIVLFPVLAIRPTTAGGIVATLFFIVFFSPGYFVLAALLYRSYQKIAGEHWLGTPKLKQIWPDIEGYREYLKVTELNRLQIESDDQQLVTTNRALPYAIALGLNTGWQKKL